MMFKQYCSRGLLFVKACHSTVKLRNFSNWKILTPNSLWSYSKGGPWSNFCIRNFQQRHPNHPVPIKRNNDYANPLRINTNVKNNVMLYRFEKPYMFKLASVFAIVATIGCLTMADNVYLVLCKNLTNPNVDLWTRIYDHLLPLAAIFIALIAGPVISLTVWLVTVRNVKYCILRKGGKDVTFITYHPLKKEVKLTVPLENVSCKSARNERKGYISLKVKDWNMHFMMDKSGHFTNPELFDCTVGVQRFA